MAQRAILCGVLLHWFWYFKWSHPYRQLNNVAHHLLLFAVCDGMWLIDLFVFSISSGIPKAIDTWKNVKFRWDRQESISAHSSIFFLFLRLGSVGQVWSPFWLGTKLYAGRLSTASGVPPRAGGSSEGSSVLQGPGTSPALHVCHAGKTQTDPKQIIIECKALSWVSVKWNVLHSFCLWAKSVSLIKRLSKCNILYVSQTTIMHIQSLMLTMFVCWIPSPKCQKPPIVWVRCSCESNAFNVPQKQRDVYEGVCRIPMITSTKEEQRMINTCRKVRGIERGWVDGRKDGHR